MEVLPPFEDSTHQVFKVGDITVYPQFRPTLEDSEFQDTTINGITFKTLNGTFDVKPANYSRRHISKR